MKYRTIDDVFSLVEIKRLPAFEYNEARRERIANAGGLEELANTDQLAKALCCLRINKPEDVPAAVSDISFSLESFKYRAPEQVTNISSESLLDALNRIALNARNIDDDIALLTLAYRTTGLNSDARVDSLKQIQNQIFTSIVRDILPAALSSSITDDALLNSLPAKFDSISTIEFNSQWQHRGFNIFGQIVDGLAQQYGEKLARNTRPNEIHPARFIGNLARVYEVWTGKRATVPNRTETQPKDWRGPFPRFVETVWPLTPEGSSNIACPSDNTLRSYLKNSLSLLPQ